MATGSGARQTAPAFHDNLSFLGVPVSGGASEEVLQIGNSEKSILGASAWNGKACAPSMPIGAANAAAAPARNKVRRSSNARRIFAFLVIILSCNRAARSRRRSAITLRPMLFHTGVLLNRVQSKRDFDSRFR